MSATSAICNAAWRAAAAFALSLSTAAPTGAFEWARNIVTTPSTYAGDFGTRLWFGHARTSKDLFDTTGNVLVSRLNYGDLDVFTGEAYGRLDFNNGWFLKGSFGGGGLFNGRLTDEDFPPAVAPYSATSSQQRAGNVYYGSIDGGIKLIRGPDFHVGAFVGYHYMRDTVQAYGCAQIATNPAICGGGGIPDNVAVITQHNNWHSLRVGIEAAIEVGRRWRVAVDAAYLPYVRLYGTDYHWLRIGSGLGSFTGGIPEDGNGWGYQIDGFVSYRLNDWLSVGAGGRYWHAEARGHTHFEGRVVGVNAQPQVVQWRADHFGGFLQASVKFGPIPTQVR